MTYSYAILDVSPGTFDEIAEKLRAAGYDHAFDRDVIDMHGIALRANATSPHGDASTEPEKGDIP